jgi:uncharacterized protein (TIGR02271 family)
MERHGDAEMTARVTKAGLAPKTAEPLISEPLKQPVARAELREVEARPSLETRALNDEQVVSVVQEELRVGKRKVQRAPVRVTKHVTETPVEETINLHDETVTIERRPVDRIANEADLKAFGESKIEMIETFEEPVISKEAHVVEEIRISKKAVDHQERITDKVRRTSIDIEGSESGKLKDADFRNDFSARFGRLGRSYSEYAPAYELGSTLATDERFATRDWNGIEFEARRQWEAKGQGSWKDFRDAVRYGWDKFRRKAA